MHRRNELTARYGLIGRKLGHSFSPSYFRQKFEENDLDAEYVLYELDQIEKVVDIFKEGINGLNVTIPYKNAILPFLNHIDIAAREIGAVNCIHNSNGQFIGYNTDWLGFTQSLKENLGDARPAALVLGSGGSSRAVQYSLKKLGISYTVVSRSENGIGYDALNETIIRSNQLIINTTPLGMFPDTKVAPKIPYEYIDDQHFLFDLIYNPEKTLFLTLGFERGARIQNGWPMLKYQAEASWQIWNS